MKKVLIGSGIIVMVFLAGRALWMQNEPPALPGSGVMAPLPEQSITQENTKQDKSKESPEGKTKSLLDEYGILESKTIFLLNGTTIAQGASLNVLGQGFTPKEELSFMLKGTNIPEAKQIQSMGADENGNFGAGIPISADIPPGKYTLQVVGSMSGKTSITDFELKSGLPWVEPSQWAGKPLSFVTFNGHGFRQGEIVEVFFDSLAGDPVFRFVADKKGDFEIPNATVPFTTGGQHAFLFVGQDSKIPVRLPYSVIALNPWATLSTYSVKQEDYVGFSVQDFAPGEVIRVYYNKIAGEPLAMAVADETGGIIKENAFTVPLGEVGMNTVYFVGESSFVISPVEFEVIPFTPGLELTAYAGNPGTDIALIGSGFARNEMVRAYFGSSQNKKEMSTFQTDDTGSFQQAGQFSVPFRLYTRSQPVTVVGEKSKVPVEVVFEVLAFSPWLGLDPYNGPPDSSVSFLGGGFARNETITIHKGDASSLVVATGTTDEEGNFVELGPFEIPAEARGRITFTALGESSGVEITAIYEVIEGQSPTTPEAEN